MSTEVFEYMRQLARSKGVWFSISYWETEDTWEGGVDSAAPVERWHRKRCKDVTELVGEMMAWMEGL